MILHGLSAEMLARLMSLDRPGDSDSWLLFGPTLDVVEEESVADTPMRWAAE